MSSEIMNVVEEAIAREIWANFGVVSPRKLAERVLEAIRVQEIIDFEAQHEKDLLTMDTPF